MEPSVWVICTYSTHNGQGAQLLYPVKGSAKSSYVPQSVACASICYITPGPRVQIWSIVHLPITSLL